MTQQANGHVVTNLRGANVRHDLIVFSLAFYEVKKKENWLIKITIICI